MLSCPSHQQRWFGTFKAKADFSFLKKIIIINPAVPPSSLPLGFLVLLLLKPPAPRHLALPRVHAAFRHLPLALPGWFSCCRCTERRLPSAPNTGASPAASSHGRSSSRGWVFLPRCLPARRGTAVENVNSVGLDTVPSRCRVWFAVGSAGSVRLTYGLSWRSPEPLAAEESRGRRGQEAAGSIAVAGSGCPLREAAGCSSKAVAHAGSDVALLKLSLP